MEDLGHLGQADTWSVQSFGSLKPCGMRPSARALPRQAQAPAARSRSAGGGIVGGIDNIHPGAPPSRYLAL